MPWKMRLTALLLLLTMTAVLPAAAFALCNAAPAHAAHCHHHLPGPSPRSEKHECCAEANHAGIPRAAILPRGMSIHFSAPVCVAPVSLESDRCRFRPSAFVDPAHIDPAALLHDLAVLTRSRCPHGPINDSARRCCRGEDLPVRFYLFCRVVADSESRPGASRFSAASCIW